MMPQNLMMCRESRKILTELETQAQKYNIGTLVIPTHVYIADQLALKYFTAPMLNAIKSKIKNMRTRSSKHFTIEYWVPVLEQMFSMNASARREDTKITTINCTSNMAFQSISQYLITDYSIADAVIVNDVVSIYSEKMIEQAIHTSRQNNVYNIQYLRAVLEKMHAMSQIERQKIGKLVTKAESSSSILDKPKVQHTPLDIAMAQYNWQKLQEDAELERKFNEILRD